MPTAFHGHDEPQLTLSPGHLSEVDETNDTDAHVVATIEWCIAQVELAARTIGEKNRYVDVLRDLHIAIEEMPQPREEGDDPFAD